MDFIGNLLNQMSSAFNQETAIPKKEEISMDETLKWRALKNNQFASRTRQPPCSSSSSGGGGSGGRSGRSRLDANGQPRPGSSATGGAMMALSSAENSNDSGPAALASASAVVVDDGRRSLPILDGSLDDTNSSALLSNGGASSTPDLMIAGMDEDDDLEEDGIEIEIAKDISGEELKEALGLSQLVVETIDDELSQQSSNNSVPTAPPPPPPSASSLSKTPIMKSEDEDPEIVRREGVIGATDESSITGDLQLPPTKTEKPEVVATTSVAKGEEKEEEEGEDRKDVVRDSIQSSSRVVASPVPVTAAAADAADDDVVIIAPSAEQEVVVLVAEDGTKEEEEEDEEKRGACASAAASESAATTTHMTTVAASSSSAASSTVKCTAKKQQSVVLPDADPVTATSVASVDEVERKYRPQENDPIATTMKEETTTGTPSVEGLKLEESLEKKTDPERAGDGAGEEKVTEIVRSPSAGRATRSKKTSISSSTTTTTTVTPPPLAGVGNAAAQHSSSSQRRSQRFVKDSPTGKLNGEQQLRSSPVVVKEEQEEPTIKKKTTDESPKQPNVSMATTSSKVAAIDRSSSGSSSAATLKSDRSLRSKQSSHGGTGTAAAAAPSGRRASETVKSTCQEDSNDSTAVVELETVVEKPPNRRGRKRLSHQEQTVIAPPLPEELPVATGSGTRSVFPLDPGENDSGGKQQQQQQQPAPVVAPAPTPGRRGRKRKNPIPVDGAVNAVPAAPAAASAYGKRMLRMSRDGSEGILASALARRDKVDSQGRSSRPIKLSAKMLANEELRQGFEQHNNGRIIIASDIVNTEDTTADRDRDRAAETASRKHSATMAAAAAAATAATSAVAATKAGSIGTQKRADRAGSESSLSNSSEDVTLVSVTKVIPTVAAPVGTSVQKRGSAEAKETKRLPDTIQPASTEAPLVKDVSNEGFRATIQQQQASPVRCPDLQTFLQEVRSMRLGTSRSPEENPKLNRRQIKRLGKLKEKHLLALGLRRRSKENQRNGGMSASAAEQSDGASAIPSDTESSGSEAEFVPSGKIGMVGKPSVTLRLRKPETLLENARSLAGAQRPASLASGPSSVAARSGSNKANKQQQQLQQTNGRTIASVPGPSSRRQSAIVLPAAATTLPLGPPFHPAPPSKDIETEHLQRSLKRLGCEVTIIPQVPRPQGIAISSSSAPRGTSGARSGAGSSQRKQQKHNKIPKGVDQAAQALRTLSSVSPSLEIVLDKRPVSALTALSGNKRTGAESSGPAKALVEASGTVAGGAVEGELVCLCAQISDVYVRRPAGNGYCTAIDDIDGQPIGCCNELTEDEVIMLRPSASVSFQVFCNMHRKRLEDHGCCAVCGQFCTQGNFAMCKNVHLFHPNCAKKYILNTPYNPHRPEDSSAAPMLVLQCPHCARECPNGEIQVNIQLTTPPVLLPSRSNVVKPAKMTVSKADSGSTNGGTVGDDIFRTKVNSLVPSSVKNMLVTSSSGAGGINGSGSTAAAPRAGSSAGRSERSSNGTGGGSGSRRKTTFTKQEFYRAITHHNDVDRISEIIASGFDIETRFADIQGGTCLHLVANYGTITTAYLIISRARSVDYLNIADNMLRTAMMCALEQKKFDIIKLLLDCGADATVKGPDGMTVLHIAARHGYHEAVRTILESARKRLTARELSSFLNRGDGGRWTALAWAAENRHKETIQQLLELGADVNVCDLENNTALHWATLAGCTDTLYLLLNKCCDTNVQNTSGDTPLHIACRLGHASSCILLMAKGASLTIRNNAGEQPMDTISDPDSECASILGANLKMRLLAKNTRETRVLSSDISNGRERYPVQVVQTVGANDRLQELPKFKYVKRTVQVECSVQMDTNLRNMRLCSCTEDCSSEAANCVCSERGWYNAEGRLVDDFNYYHPPEIVECGDACDCNRLVCRNRVVQRGLLVPLQIFYNPSKGWSVRTLVRIAKGSFLVEYVGELLTDEAADRRPDDSYIFDLGAGYCMDASAYGNVSRFFNHSCKPNVSPVRVFYEHQDTRFPKVAMFACRDIQPQEEICFDYGDKFWMVKNRTVCCQCNASECRYRTVQQAGDGCPVTVVL